MPRSNPKEKGEKMEMKQYRLRVMNDLGTLTETLGYFTFADALQACVKLAAETIDPDYLKKCELGDWKITETSGTHPLHHTDRRRADMFLCVMPMMR